MTAKKQISFEERLRRLEEVSDHLKSSETSIEEAIKMYEEGIGLYKECREILDNAVQKVSVYDRELDEFTSID